MSDDKTNNRAEPSPASTGSVLCVWGWVQIDWDGTEFVIPCSDQCEATHRASRAGKAVQFFPKPTLTAAEREAISDAADRYAALAPESAETVAILRGLLERLAP